MIIFSYSSKDIFTVNNQESNYYIKESEIHEEKYYCKFNCNKNKTECNPYYNFMLICKENPYSNTFLKIHISSFDYEGVK